MVVGDRLWLFSQTPAATHSQSMMLSNSPTLIRGYGMSPSIPPAIATASSTPSSSLVHENTFNNYLAPSKSLNFGIHKPDQFFHRIPHGPPSNDVNQLKYPFNKFLACGAFAKPTEIIPGNYFNKFKITQNDMLAENYSPISSNNIAELERAFGSSKTQLDSKCSKLMDSESNNSNNDILEDFCENSDVDCEELDGI